MIAIIIPKSRYQILQGKKERKLMLRIYRSSGCDIRRAYYTYMWGLVISGWYFTAKLRMDDKLV